MEQEPKPIDLFEQRLKRRQPTDIGGMAMLACLREAVAEKRITPQEAEERIDTYLVAYAGQPLDKPPDIIA